MSLMDKLKKNSTVKDANVITESPLFGPKDMASTDVPAINVALSGRVDGGLGPGLLVLAGPSKHFKTNFSLKMAQAYMNKHKDSVMLFYDTEFGSPQEYFESFSIPMDRVFHTPVDDIEEMRHDIANQLDSIEKGDKIIIVVDSIGNAASRKENDDAKSGNSAADMTRAKVLKSLFRIVTPKLKRKEIPMIAINHTYQSMEMFSKPIVSGGTGIYYSADDIWIIGRRQVKEGTEVTGYDFVVNIDKSRYVKEKSKIPISVSWEGGIKQWSGLLDMALEGNYVAKPKNGWYQMVDRETGELVGKSYREKETHDAEFWVPILKDTDFPKWIMNKYKQQETELQTNDYLEVLEGLAENE